MALLICHMESGGSKVMIAPSYGHPAAVNAAAVLGYKIYLCDVDESGCMSLDSMMNMTHDNDVDTAVGVLVHVLHNGRSAGARDAAVETRELLCGRWLTILDACQAMQSVDDVFPLPEGSAVVLSFSPQKIVTTGQGGAVLTDDANLAERVRGAICQGIAERGTLPHKCRSMGVNLRMSNVAAAIGLSQMRRYADTLERWADIRVWYGQDWNRWCPVVASGRPVRLMAELAEHGIQSARLYESTEMNGSLPVANRHLDVRQSSLLAWSNVYLPGHLGVRREDVEQIKAVVRDSKGKEEDEDARGAGQRRTGK
jgi:perosamine synthetase